MEVPSRLSGGANLERTGSVPSDVHIFGCQFLRRPKRVTKCCSVRVLETNLVTNKGLEFLNGPFPEPELVLESGGVGAEMRVEQDLVQQHVMSATERPRGC